MAAYEFLCDVTEQTTTRFVTFVTERMNRFDLAITTTGQFYGKKLVTNLQNGKTAIVGPDDLKEPGYLSYAFQISEEEEEDLLPFMEEIIGFVEFPNI